MATKFFIDTNNNYIGGYDGSLPPVGGVEVPAPPKHAKAKWNGSTWDEPVIVPSSVKKEKVQRYLENVNKWNFFKRIRDTKPLYIDNWESVDNIDSSDDLLRVVSKGIGVSVEDILIAADAITNEELILTEAEQLEEAKNIAKALVGAERDRRKNADVVYKGHQYGTTEWDILMIMSLLTTSNDGKALPTDDYWRTADNANVNLNNNDLNNLDSLIKYQIQTAYVYSWTKKAMIDACTSIAEIDALDLEINTD